MPLSINRPECSRRGFVNGCLNVVSVMENTQLFILMARVPVTKIVVRS